MQRFGSPRRIGGAILALGIGLIVLWQAGVFSSPGETATKDDAGQTVELQPADASIDTPVTAGREVGLREGDLAPDFEFSTFDGTRMRLSDLRGKPVFVNFWASWCGPCRAELPTLETKLREHEADGLVILGVNTGERLQTAERFLDKLGVKLTAYVYDPAADVGKRYGIPGLPTSYLVDSNGVITGVFAIQMTDTMMEDAIQHAIAGYGAPVD
jgi:thiol-disulfide isomerase/thioredoxin